LDFGLGRAAGHEESCQASQKSELVEHWKGTVGESGRESRVLNTIPKILARHSGEYLRPIDG
ncbi:MAG: hypothetical protein ACK4L7_09400, partial [Flavobacteriales bacterium]